MGSSPWSGGWCSGRPGCWCGWSSSPWSRSPRGTRSTRPTQRWRRPAGARRSMARSACSGSSNRVNRAGTGSSPPPIRRWSCAWRRWSQRRRTGEALIWDPGCGTDHFDHTPPRNRPPAGTWQGDGMRGRATLRGHTRAVAAALALLGAAAGCGAQATTPRPAPASTAQAAAGQAAWMAIVVGAAAATSNPTASATATPTTVATPTATARGAATPRPTATATATVTPTATVSARPAGGYPHILVIMEESQSYADTLGTCGSGTPDPYWCSLASEYASMTSWSGVEEPYSLPNYLAITGGSTQGCTNDICLTPDTITSQDLGGQLTAAGIPWTADMESMPTACDTDNRNRR